MGLISATEENEKVFLKYSSSKDFNPYAMSPSTLRAFFAEVFDNIRWLS
jgi:hypothetical protein